jgi:hypothetical protein
MIDTAQRRKLEGLRAEFETERRLATTQAYIDTQPGWTVRSTTHGFTARREMPDGSVRFAPGRNTANLKDGISFFDRIDRRKAAGEAAKQAAKKKSTEATTPEESKQ